MLSAPHSRQRRGLYALQVARSYLAHAGGLAGLLTALACPLVVQEAVAADRHCGADTDLNGSVDTWCPTPDEDGDGYTSDGSGEYSTGAAQVNGAQATVNTITVDAGHTFWYGKSAVFSDSVSGGTVTRDVLAWTDTTITVGGNAVTVSDNATITAGTITDPDDQNRYIRPGVPTSVGCSAGNYRTGQKDGTFTGCAAVSGFTCHSGSGSTYFFDDAETDCSGTGAYADPENYLCASDTGMSGYHAPTAGDCFVLRAGTYDDFWSDLQMHVVPDGTALNPIQIVVLPGETWWEAGVGAGAVIEGQGTWSPKVQIHPIYVEGGSYAQIRGVEISQGTGFSNAGIHVADADGVRVTDTYVHDIDGEEDDNMTCVKFRVQSDWYDVGWNVWKDCYERFATTGDADWNAGSSGNSEFRSMDCDGGRVHHNVVTASNIAALGITFKHAVASAKGVHVYRNIVFDLHKEGIAVDGIPNSTVLDNYIDHVNLQNSGAGISLKNYGGSTANYTNFEIAYNTILNAPSLQFNPENTSDPGVNVLNFHHNVIVDDRASAYGGDGDDGFLRISHYGSDTIHGAVSSRITIDNNCYFNSTTPTPPTLFFTFFGADQGGAGDEAGYTATGLTAWRAASPFDDNSFVEDPDLDSTSQATSTNCTGKGIRFSAGGSPTTTTSTTTTTSSTTSTTSTSGRGNVFAQ